MTQYQGKTVDEAIQNGLKKIQIDRDKVAITVVSEPVHGWFGRLKKEAIVDITIKPVSVTKTPQSAKASAGASTGATSSRTTQSKPLKNAKTSPTFDHPSGQRVAAKRDEDIERNVDATADVRQREGDHPHAKSSLTSAEVADSVAASTETTSTVSTTATMSSAVDQSQSASLTDSITSISATTQLTPEELKARQRANQARLDDNLEAVANYLLDVLEQLGISADAEADTYHHGATITFMTEQEGLLIGRHGRTLNALQVLGNTFMLRQGMQHFELMLDVAGYRERRASTLKRLADNTARDVIAGGEPELLDPMPAYERKVIHTQLAKNTHVTTFSQGREPRRGIVVAPR